MTVTLNLVLLIHALAVLPSELSKHHLCMDQMEHKTLPRDWEATWSGVHLPSCLTLRPRPHFHSYLQVDLVLPVTLRHKERVPSAVPQTRAQLLQESKLLKEARQRLGSKYLIPEYQVPTVGFLSTRFWVQPSCSVYQVSCLIRTLMFLQMEKPWRQYTIWLLSTCDNNSKVDWLARAFFFLSPFLVFLIIAIIKMIG